MINNKNGAKDEETGMLWFKKAADQGHIPAYEILGYNYLQKYCENKIQKDMNQAIYWFQKLANQNDAEAQHTLGWIYHREDLGQVNIKKQYIGMKKSHRKVMQKLKMKLASCTNME